jgi:L-tartrate/succinate antiporter
MPTSFIEALRDRPVYGTDLLSERFGEALKYSWKALVPIGVAVILALLPAPAGLPQHAWYFFAIFVGVIVALMFEPIPGAAIGLISVTLVTVLASTVLFSPEQLAQPGFNATEAALGWALSGFSNRTVWLIFGAFMFALGYEKSGLGRRVALILVKLMGRRTLNLGYAVTVADTLLAPFTPSNTARSAGTIYSVISHLPPLYDSKPNDPSSRRIGSYLMWVAIATTCVTSSLFMTALAPNLLAAELVRKTVNVELHWGQWFLAFAPVGIPLLLLVPLITYWVYPPQVKQGEGVPAWAAQELQKMGRLTAREVILGVLIVLGLGLFIFGDAYVKATTTALIVTSFVLG